MQKHYEEAFKKFGASAKGVDWGKCADVEIRHKKMLQLFDGETKKTTTLLDVGCGYGAFLEFLKRYNIDVDYHGIDLARNSIAYARNNFPDCNFELGDFLAQDFKKKFDYLVCNGILTQKLEASSQDMELFTNELLKKMFSICDKGIAFNLMTNKVNYYAPNLYYRSPVEILSFCFDNLSNQVLIDHSYPLYEYTVYVYRK